jgi:hypothetical protein
MGGSLDVTSAPRLEADRLERVRCFGGDALAGYRLPVNIILATRLCATSAQPAGP